MPCGVTNVVRMVRAMRAVSRGEEYPKAPPKQMEGLRAWYEKDPAGFLKDLLRYENQESDRARRRHANTPSEKKKQKKWSEKQVAYMASLKKANPPTREEKNQERVEAPELVALFERLALRG